MATSNDLKDILKINDAITPMELTNKVNEIIASLNRLQEPTYGVVEQLAQGIYKGVNLEEKFSDEIKAAGSVSAWLHKRCSAADFTGIYPFDYFYDNMSAGIVAGNNIPAQKKKICIAGIDMYYGTGEENNTMPHHVTCFTLIDDYVKWNDINNNNGSTYSEHPWIASKLYAILNGVNNASTNKIGNCGYNAQGAGYYHLLSESLRNNITEQYIYLEKRYSSTAGLLDSNNQDWASRGKIFAPSEVEVYGRIVHSIKSTYSQHGNFGPFCHWPIFSSAGRNGQLLFGNIPFWLSSVPAGNQYAACMAGSLGTSNVANTSATYSVAPLCFHIS